MPPNRPTLNAFAPAVADRLPGHWTSRYDRRITYPEHYSTTARLWDAAGHVAHLVDDYVYPHYALLHGPGEMQLYVTDRPLKSGEFVIAPLVPDDGTIMEHHFDGIDEPSGITVPADPVRAAALIARRLLPTYATALEGLRLHVAERRDPPRLPAPRPVRKVVTLTWYPDGTFGAPYTRVPPEARSALFMAGFCYFPHRDAFILSAEYPAEEQARRLKAVAQALTSAGIGVNLRTAGKPAGPATTPPQVRGQRPPRAR
ncbi:hypothetical protein GCM10010400_38080 [Streptomyces aculeolatus]|uniref:hypothetical protein n=1 Tax=Streptomyces aculeolatus TaxID=270689 RepID=UPI001CEC5CD1|nr:hypothetical protein [Streptomyces aculeolatus]